MKQRGKRIYLCTKEVVSHRGEGSLTDNLNTNLLCTHLGKNVHHSCCTTALLEREVYSNPKTCISKRIFLKVRQKGKSERWPTATLDE